MTSGRQRRIGRPLSRDGGSHVTIQKPDLSLRTDLPAPPRYVCKRTDTPIVIDGRLDEAVWQRVQWSDPFGDIEEGPATVSTRIALLWDDTSLYVGFQVEDHDVRGTMGDYHDHVYVQDDDVEIFFGGSELYYELGINPINNLYQLQWVWLEQLVRENRFDELEHWLTRDDFIYYRRRRHEPLGRIGDLNYTLPGLQTAVAIDGVLNNPAIEDRGWTVEIALPWAGLADAVGEDFAPPAPGDVRRMVGYRAHHDHADPERFGEAGATPWEQQTWSVMGNSNIHNPERWAEVTFSDETV